MINRKSQLKFITKRWDEIDFHLHSFCETKDQEELHKARVTMKKMFAFFKLVAPKLKRKEVGPIRKLFKHAGEIRDLHIRMKRLQDSISSSKKYYDDLHEELISLTEQFCIKIDKWLKEAKKCVDNISKDFENVKNDDVKEFYNKRLKRIATAFYDTDNEIEWHACRKRIKVLLYNYDKLPGPVNRKLKLNTNYLDELQDKIGKWHDSEINADAIAALDLDIKKDLIKFKKQTLVLSKAVKLMATDFNNKVLMQP